MALTAGTRLGPYEILSPLGSGGMGEVYRARDGKLDRDVAIKVLPESVATDPDRLARFEREAKAVAALSHPNVLAIHDFATHAGTTYAVMELLEGDALRARIQAGAVPWKHAVGYAVQIARGLSAAHEKGIVHRDLKPENVFVRKDGHVTILDFGLARRIEPRTPGEATSAPTVSRQTEPGTVMGTVGYMSPEQVRGLPVDHRSDLFSFGAILYELVSGKGPFKRDTASDTLAAILKEEPRDVAGVSLPRKLKSIVRRLLEKDPANRYATAEEVHAELLALQASLRPAGLPRTAWAALAVVVVVAAAGTAWLGHRWSRERWALETATPEIARLVDAEEFEKAAALLREARAVLPKDPALEKLWMKATGEATVESDPPGAEVSIRPYGGDPSTWESLGKTPLTKVRVPASVSVFRVVKPGFATESFLDSPVAQWTLKLASAESVPPGMVHVSCRTASLGWPLNEAPAAKIDDFWIDQHEVTNEEFKRFVDAGGYEKQEFWKQPFVKDGRAIPWQEALSQFRDATGRPGPATWEVGAFLKGLDKHPVAGVSWFEALAYAEFAGKSLPTIYHWYGASQSYFNMLINPGSNLRGSGTQPIGAPGTLSGFGTTDMAGNVKEWCWNESRAGKRFVLGGGFGDPSYMFQFTDAQSPWDRRANYGFRCAKLSSPPPAATTTKFEGPLRDYTTEEPVSSEVFRAYLRLYAYDKGELGARVEESTAAAEWRWEKVSINAAYGGERFGVHVFLPRNSVPPFQVVVFYPGAYAYYMKAFEPSLIDDYLEFVPRSGRALVVPVYRGQFERQDGLMLGGQPPARWRDRAIMQAKDLGRTLDYLATRKDMDNSRLAYFGHSAGGAMAPEMLAVEQRFKAAILLDGGLWFRNPLPEVDWINFVTRVTTPVLMLNGRYDEIFPLETSQTPLFRRLGTLGRDKKHVLYEADHNGVPQKERARESLDWLDKYLGPVSR